MNPSRTHRGGVPARTLAIVLNVIALAIVAALLAGGVARTLGAHSIDNQVSSLSGNLSQLIQIRQDNLDQLSAQLETAQTELAQVEAETPQLGAPYQLYERGFALGPENKVEVESIAYGGEETQSTALGSLGLDTYSISLVGDIPGCINYVSQLETEGAPYLATERVTMQSGDPGSCSLNTAVLGTDLAGLPAAP
jgi:outer membrane murein-binding lipoprotein Lpp